MRIKFDISHQFDIETGRLKTVTAKGNHVTIFCFDADNGSYPVIGRIDRDPRSVLSEWTSEGENENPDDNLYLIPPKKSSEKRKYTIHCTQLKLKDADYIENSFSQCEISNLSEQTILDYLKVNQKEIWTCFDAFLNHLGALISDKKLSPKDFTVILHMEGKDVVTEFDDKGYIIDWVMGFFNSFQKAL